MNSKVLVLIVECIPEPIENMGAKTKNNGTSITNNYRSNGDIHICGLTKSLVDQMFPNLSEKMHQLYIDADPNTVRDIIIKNSFGWLSVLPDNDYKRIKEIRGSSYQMKKMLNKSNRIKRTSEISTDEEPTISIEALIDIFEDLSNDNYHFDAVKIAIIKTVSAYIEDLSCDGILSLFKTFKTDDSRVDALELLLNKLTNKSIINNYINKFICNTNTYSGRIKVSNIVENYVEDVTYDYLLHTIKDLQESKQWTEIGLVELTMTMLSGFTDELKPDIFIGFFESVAKKWSIPGQIKVITKMNEKMRKLTFTDYFKILKFFVLSGVRSNNLYEIVNIISTKINLLSSNEFCIIAKFLNSELGESDTLKRVIDIILDKTEFVIQSDFIELMTLFKETLSYASLCEMNMIIEQSLDDKLKISKNSSDSSDTYATPIQENQ